MSLKWNQLFFKMQKSYLSWLFIVNQDTFDTPFFAISPREQMIELFEDTWPYIVVSPSKVYIDHSHQAHTKQSLRHSGQDVKRISVDSKEQEIPERPTRSGSSNNTKLICNLVLLDMTEETKCWNWLKSQGIHESYTSKLFSIFRGFILISPNSPPVERITRKLSNWMDNFKFIQKMILDLDVNAETYQDILYNSDLAKTVHILRRMVYNINNVTPSFSNEMLQHLDTVANFFLNSSNPQAGLPNLRDSVQIIADAVRCFRIGRFLVISNEQKVEEVATCLMEYSQFFGAVMFQQRAKKATTDTSSGSLQKLTMYKIRLAHYLTDKTTRIVDKTQVPWKKHGLLQHLKYLYFGFLLLQEGIDKAVIEELTNTTTKIGVYVQQFPNPCFTVDKFISTTANFLPLCMTLAWVLTFSLITKNVVYEKELRLKEFMKVMGLGNLMHWIAWYIQAMAIVAISTMLFVTILKFGRLVQKTDFTVLTVFVLLYANASIFQAFLVSTLFDNANLAANCGGFVYLTLFLPYPILSRFFDVMTYMQKLTACLVAQVAFGHGCMYLSMWDEDDKQLHWGNLHTSPDKHDNFNFLSPMLMLAFDSILYAILTWYIETVFPGAYGIPRRWYFAVQKSYWFGESQNNLRLTVNEPEEVQKRSACVEQPHKNTKVGVAVRNLVKIFSNGKVALNGLSLDFYENQITSFLGHNGAGKTTTISILTGLYPPSSGTVVVDGMDIRTHMGHIQKSLGMCPQYNVLFETLTVEEQLRFYAGLKGMTNHEIDTEIERMLGTLNLIPKRNVQAKFLSGGMKRKLSIAVAFLGNSKIVVLDEPTAGVDPYARRQIWDLLVQYKTGRTIIMSTHHMDEADLLGDRIAIIVSGKLKCCGSSLFLKNQYGSSYYLTMVMDQSFRELKVSKSTSNLAQAQPKKRMTYSLTDADSMLDSSETTITLSSEDIHPQMPSSKKIAKRSKSAANLSGRSLKGLSQIADKDIKEVVDLLTRFICNFLPGSIFVERIGHEFIFSLPRNRPRQLAMLFAELDKCQDSDKCRKLGIASYGISETKLEEIFLKFDPVEDDTADRPQTPIYKKLAKYFRELLQSFRRPKKPKVPVLISNSRSADVNKLQRPAQLLKSKTTAKESLISNMMAQEMLASRGPWWLHMRQICALYTKRYLNFKRNLKGAFCEIILPIFMIAFTMVALSLQPTEFHEQPPLRLSPWLYGPPNYIFYSFNYTVNSTNNMSYRVLSTIVHPPGPSFRCVPEQPFKYPWRLTALFLYIKSTVYYRDLTCLNVSPTERFSGAKSYKDVKTDQSLCSCYNASSYKCPKKAYHPGPPTRLSETTDFLTNMTMLNITQWLLITERKFRMKRYGGFSLGEVNPVTNKSLNWKLIDKNLQILSILLSNFSQSVKLDWQSAKRNSPIVDVMAINRNELSKEWYSMNFTNQLSVMLDGLDVKNNVKVWFNNKGWAALPSYVNVLSNALLRANLPQDQWPQYGIVTFNHPMKYSAIEQGPRIAKEFEIGSELMAAVMIILAFSVIPASFVLFLIEERASDAKHLHLVSGVEPTIYWIANFAWDLTNFLIPIIGIMFGFLIFNELAYISSFRNAVATFLLLYIYGYATMPVMYLFTFVFRVPSLAFIWLATGNLLCGWLTTTVTSILETLEHSDPLLITINYYCKIIFLFIPQYCLGRGMLEMKSQYLLYKGAEFALGSTSSTNPFQWNILGGKIFAMTIEGTLAFLLVLFIENYTWKAQRPDGVNGCNNNPPADEDDDDYQKGNCLTRTCQSLPCSCCKVPEKSLYTRAVDQVCFSVQKGECFGLLGVNGAGKTSMFNMLTGKIRVSAGDAFIHGMSVQTDRDTVRKRVGFCPQFDALNERLTANEQLTLYARLRGIEEKNVDSIVNSLVDRLNLKAYADRFSKTYSGGNKRKLSTAIALLGNPSVVLFDEPTTGMDPKARRFLWNKINEITRDGRSVILTSHSMEECEVLCSRLGIMVNGRFCCMGSVQHLKNKYGEGYTLTVKLSHERPLLEAMNKAVKSRFPLAVLREQHYCQLKYRFPSKGVKLSEIFNYLVEVQKLYHIEDYSVSQTTLDEVFVSLQKLKKQS